MQCSETIKKLNALVDSELSSSESEEAEQHLNNCQACRLEYESVKHIYNGLKNLPDIIPHDSLSRKTIRAFQKEFFKPGFREWWKGLSFFMRSAVCGVTLTGMLCGAILCNSIITRELTQPSDPYQTLYAYKGIL